MSHDAELRAKGWLKSLPPLPKAAQFILSALHDENASWQAVAAALENDPAITLRVLSLVNSPFYGVAGRVQSAGDAVQILGLTTLTGLVLACALRPPTFEADPPRIDVESFWRQALLNAQLSRKLADRLGLDADVSYLASVLGDAGVLLQSVLNRSAAADLGCTDASSLSALAGEHWGLPSAVVQVQRDIAAMKPDQRMARTLPFVIAISPKLMTMPETEVTGTNSFVISAAEAFGMDPPALVQDVTRLRTPR